MTDYAFKAHQQAVALAARRFPLPVADAVRAEVTGEVARIPASPVAKEEKPCTH